MKRGSLVNLLIGIAIALLPLYVRVCALDFQRTAKDNLLVGLFCLLNYLLGSPKRKIGKTLFLFLLYASASLVLNQWNVLTVNVIFQFFYISSGLLFFFSYYEKHDTDGTHFILKGMIAGALIQSVFAIPGHFGFELYPAFVSFFTEIGTVTSTGAGASNTIGSLGNADLLASYLAICSPAFFTLKKGKLLIIFPLIAIWLTGSLMGLFSFVAGALYFFNSKKEIFKKWHFYVAATLSMIVYPFSGIGYDSGRIGIWASNLSKVDLKHFFFGGGPGWFADQRIMMSADIMVVQEHNAFLSAFNVFGIIGLLLVVPTLIKFIFKKDGNPIFASVLFAAFVNSYGHFTLHQSTVAIIIIVAAGICLAEGNDNGIDMERVSA